MAADATKLESVNEILGMAGLLPANSLETTRPDVLRAKTTLDQVDRSVQSQGWHWNSQYNQTFSPNADSQIALPGDVFEVSESSGDDSPVRRYRDKLVDYQKRGGLLYNALSDTFTFTGDVKLNLIRKVDFDDIPQYAREYITKRAAREFFELARGSRSPVAEQREQEALSTLRSAEYRQADFNFFRGPDTGWVERYR